MANILLRPDLKTAGGECHDILFKGRFAGSLTLIYREKERLVGSLQLDKDSINSKEKKQISEFIHTYVQSLIYALQVNECEVMTTYSRYDHIIGTGQEAIAAGQGALDHDDYDEWDGLYDDELEADDYEEDVLEDIAADHGSLSRSQQGKYSREDDDDPSESESADYFELVIVGERRNQVEYHVYDREQNWLAEVFVSINGADVSGEVNWNDSPTEAELEAVADLLVSDFDENEIDSFHIEMKYDGALLETIELTHEDLLDDRYDYRENEWVQEEDYSAVLIRDDGDTLTYDIYDGPYNGKLPIGTATVDISSRELAGFIDFRDPGSEDEREQIASILLRELDKEKDYRTANFTMLYKNEPIDEILFESEQTH